MTRAPEPPEQGVLFELGAAPISLPRKGAPTKPRPVWTKYRVKTPVKCDDCMRALAESYGQGPASSPARWKRKVGTQDWLLCYHHAAIRRASDGLGPPSLPSSGPT